MLSTDMLDQRHTPMIYLRNPLTNYNQPQVFVAPNNSQTVQKERLSGKSLPNEILYIDTSLGILDFEYDRLPDNEKIKHVCIIATAYKLASIPNSVSHCKPTHPTAVHHAPWNLEHSKTFRMCFITKSKHKVWKMQIFKAILCTTYDDGNEIENLKADLLTPLSPPLEVRPTASASINLLDAGANIPLAQLAEQDLKTRPDDMHDLL
eukprot:TRINITY_DN10804_c0_g1_i1.p1 TRINITY_DN10804_c0_g1~~TRINITY_DN10804_c0_g1_i1.p1  ORF type:complete len:207 (-),score=26.88 TRINITY_DN10804_c0_g1_i1:68-688(-)